MALQELWWGTQHTGDDTGAEAGGWAKVQPVQVTGYSSTNGASPKGITQHRLRSESGSQVRQQQPPGPHDRPTTELHQWLMRQRARSNCRRS